MSYTWGVAADWESRLDRWLAEGVLDHETAERIRAWERGQAQSQGLRWPILLALVCGAVLVAAGVLLFVSAHWDQLSPAGRMTVVLLLVAGFHAGGAAVAERFEALSMAMHTVGTVALGAGIALAGQIFNLSEHWPSAVLLWAVGGALGWLLLGHWTQAALTAILVPWWLAGEWVTRRTGSFGTLPVAVGICALSATYLSARRSAADSALRKALGWIGGLALLPAVALTASESWTTTPFRSADAPAWAAAIVLPIGIAFLLRGREAVWNATAVFWTLVLAALAGSSPEHLGIYFWCAVGAVGLSIWGIHDSRPERINLGIAVFACTVFAFYFSSVMDKMGRSESLMGLGVLFLGGGWLLERTRRRLMAHIRPEAS
ncbi:MAG TPA: DUF2157 domain-containing protein [Verrucomicrobiae bacterium]|nr:DUF2157 domain-containing protein [Verrucomicrobiae bacterium]